MKISNIARASLHDGPGARSVVYFAGCSLRCLWCHNPETISAVSRPLFARAHCVLCGGCARVCPAGCHVFSGAEHQIDFRACVSCGACADACPAGALSMSVRDMDVESVARAVLSDLAYYRATGGGVTLSGGECLLQASEAFALADLLRARGVHVAVETALNVPEETARAMAAHVDLALCDLKHIDDARHRALTGGGNERILRNFRVLSETALPYIARTPVIPGMTDDPANLRGIRAFLRTLPRPPLAHDLLPYNNLGESKYDSMGIPYPLKCARPQLGGFQPPSPPDQRD